MKLYNDLLISGVVKSMTQEERLKIISNDYTDLFIIYNRNEKLLNRFPGATIHIMNPRIALAYTPKELLDNNFLKNYGYEALPHCYGLTSEVSLEVSGINRLRNLPGFNLRGKGVLVAIMDTGIDYTNEIFRREDGTSKIVSLWDQTINSENQYPENALYGTEYSAQQINQALNSATPLEIVPSMDEIGHGTMLAGIMVGSEVPDNNFSGIVPDADIIVVKLKQAKQNLRDFFLIPPDVPCYQENDILWAYYYIIELANKLNRPCSICVGLGTSQGPHDGSGLLSNALDFRSSQPGITTSISVGNEGLTKRHFFSTINPTIGASTVELNVGENESGFSIELWGTTPNTYSLDILSPTGEYIPRIIESLKINQEIRFIFDKTVIFVNYRLVETHTGEQLILLRFRYPTPGIWRFRVYSRGDITGSFHIWLPMNGFISDSTYFINSNRYTTVTSPGNAISPLTITSYNPQNDTLYERASRGYSRNNYIKPELAAPGVNIIVPTHTKEFTTASGTGLAAAHTAGITAILLEWGIVRGFYPDMNSMVAKKFLIRGAKRNPSVQYPNRDLGYGIIDLYNVFNVLRIDFPIR
jgi:subtilisin family serine protease